MRKPRDFDSELKALRDKASSLRNRKIVQLGELVVACGADAMPSEQLAGTLLAAVEANDAATKEAWRVRGAAFFQRKARTAGPGSQRDTGGTPTNDGSVQSAAGEPRA